MLGLSGWSAAGLPVDGPGARLLPVRDSAGAPHIALQFRDDLVGHPLLQQGIDLISAFIEKPSIEGIAPLVAWDREKATFFYPSRDGVLVATLIERCVSARKPGGVRAALELLVSVGPVLDDAARAGRRAGLPGHGALNPWRILVHPTGGSSLLGHGVPAVEIAAWLEESAASSRETREPGPGLRYFAPERIDEQDEDLRADLYALAVTAIELALGQPLLPSIGPASSGVALAEAIRGGAAVASLREASLPEPVLELFAAALAVEPGERPASGKAMASRATALIASAAGRPLLDLLAEALGSPTTRAEPKAAEPKAAEPKAAEIPPSRAPLMATLPPISEAPNSPRLAANPPPAISTRSVAQTMDPLSTGPVVNIEPPASSIYRSLPPVSTKTPPHSPRVITSNAPWATLPPADDLDDEGDEPTLVDDRIRGPDPALEEVTTPLEPAPLPVRTPEDVIAPVDDLPRDASLALIARHSQQIVSRTGKLVQQAESMYSALSERASSERFDPAILKAARTGTERANRASEAARSAASLIELDEDASGALITLDLVRNAELQCENAVRDVKAQITEIERAAERLLLQTRACADAAKYARDHANRSTDAANQADDIVSALEADAAAGLLQAPETAQAIDAAIAAAERADAAAEEARAQADLAATADRVEIANRHTEIARRAEDAAASNLQETRQAAARARALESDTKQSAIDRARAAVVTARFASEEAARALARADEASSAAREGEGAESRSLRSKCAAHTRDAAAAAAEAELAASSVRNAKTSREALEAFDDVARVVRRCETSSASAQADAERVVSLAGELARARAQLSKLQEEAHALVERAMGGVALLREEADRLQQDTALLTGINIIEARTEALTLVRDVDLMLRETESPLAQASSSSTAEQAESSVAALRQLATRISSLVDDSRQRIVQTRATAAQELALLQRRDEQRRSVEQASSDARFHAQRCRELVDHAWKVARALSPALLSTDIEEAIRNRTKALEIIDIAEFQAGEAASSAELADAESDPAEARAHTQTALSFLERITADLPEALEALDLAEAITRRETELLQGSRSKTAEIAASVEAIGVEVSAGLQAVRAETARWRSDEAVMAQMAVLEQFGVGFNEDLNESGWARDKAQGSRTGAEAAEFVPHAESAFGRAKEKKRRMDVVIDTVRRAITSAEQAVVIIQEARQNTRAASDAVASDLARLLAAQQRLADAIARHGGREEAVSNAELHMRESVGDVRRLYDELRGIAAAADTARQPDEARRLTARAGDLVRTVERACEIAAEAEARGVAAAEHEARSRNEARQRRVNSLREEAVEQVNRSNAILERMNTFLSEIDEQVASTGSELALARLTEALRLAALVRGQLTDVERASQRALSAAEEDVEKHTETTRQGAERITAEINRVSGIAQEALDLARVAAAEVEALESVRNEVTSTAAHADEAVERARAESVRLSGVVRDTSLLDPKALFEESAQHVSAATKAAAKVRAAIPLAAQADALAVAQSILRTARMALERANVSADAVRAIVDRVIEAARQEREHAAKALDDARVLAAKPAHDAAAAARKAEGWLEAGKREAVPSIDDDVTRSSLRVLERSVGEVRRLADEALAKAERAEQAATIEIAQAIAPEVTAASSLALDAAERARAALAGLRDRIGAMKIEIDAIAAVAAEAAEQAAAAGQVAEQGEASLRELEHTIEGETGTSEDILRALDWVKTASTNARFAAARAGQAAESARSSKARSDVETEAEVAHAALEDALDALEKVVEAEQFCRAAIETRREEEAAKAKQSESERKRAQEGPAFQRQAAVQQQALREQQESSERQRREEERKVNVERRREERRTGGVPSLRPANDRESLRSMLRQSRPTIEEHDSVARPRRRGDLAEPSTTQPRPEIRSWAPNNPSPPESAPESTGRMTAPKRAPRPSAPRPSVPPADPLHDEEATQPRDPAGPPQTLTRSSDSPNVDALLSRLRARRTERD